MQRGKTLLALTALVLVGAGAFFGTRALINELTAEAQDAEQPSNALPDFEAIEAELRLPRFEGELLGIYIAPTLEGLPGSYLEFPEVCASDAPSVQVPSEQAGPLSLSLSLPANYDLLEGSPNTGVIACGETVYAARWNYLVTASNGVNADVVIGRSLFREQQFDVASERVKTATFAGRQAVLIETVTPNGVSQRSGVVFPEPFGQTFVSAANLPLADLLSLAELVARATVE